MPVEHWMTFGTFAQQEYFKYPHPESYTGVILNANMVAHAPAGIAGFLLGKTKPGFPYIIDPQTHAFQHNRSLLLNSKNEVKSSIKKLASEYGNIIRSLIDERPVLPSDFGDKAELQDLVESVVKFQRDKLAAMMQESEYMKYLEFEEGEINRPYAVVAPYFYMTESTYSEWLPIVVQAAKIAVDHLKKDETKIFSAIAISKGILMDESIMDEILDSFKEVKVDGYLLWVDDLNENLSSKNTLSGLAKFVHGLREDSNKAVVNLHGGYYSLLLGSEKFGLKGFTGVAHGPGFGEFRSVVPVGGGIPIAKYYIRNLHSRVKYREALDFFSNSNWLESADEFHAHVCDCDECNKVIAKNADNFVLYGESNPVTVNRGGGVVTMEYPTTATSKRCLRHYLQNKVLEIDFVNQSDRDRLLEELDQGFAQYEKTGGLDTVAHLKQWKSVLEELT